jgi:hypothetical protein
MMSKYGQELSKSGRGHMLAACLLLFREASSTDCVRVFNHLTFWCHDCTVIA